MFSVTLVHCNMSCRNFKYRSLHTANKNEILKLYIQSNHKILIDCENIRHSLFP